jgi:glycosyltransferase involved in cell wall biosynthesis
MKVLFVHQNFPGQYRHLAPRLARDGHTVMAICSRAGVRIPGIEIIAYEAPHEHAPATHRYLIKAEEAVRRGERVAAVALRLRNAGFVPDLICVHPGWGEALYLRDVWKHAAQLHYCEFYFEPFKGPSQFRPREPVLVDHIFELRTRNVLTLLGLDSCDAGVTPTRWQQMQYPKRYHEKIAVVHEGVNVGIARPNPTAVLSLPNGRRLTRADRVVTYISRNLEPTRGFPEFMRAAADLLERNPDLHIVVIGGDEVSYGGALPKGQTWRQIMLREVEIDLQRMHFLGKVKYPIYLSALQISSVHIYLTVPFVLSWSFMEAMAAECLIVASDTAPVREVMQDSRNGLLVDFFDRDGLVRRVEEALKGGQAIESLRKAARQTIIDEYSLARCMPKQLELIERVRTGSR